MTQNTAETDDKLISIADAFCAVAEAAQLRARVAELEEELKNCVEDFKAEGYWDCAKRARSVLTKGREG